jgi:hypothetical protein
MTLLAISPSGVFSVAPVATSPASIPPNIAAFTQ